MAETPGQLIIRHQEHGDHWSLEEFRTLSIVRLGVPISELDDGELTDMVNTSTCPFDGTADCAACQASIELFERAEDAGTEPTDSQLKEWENELLGPDEPVQKWDGDTDVKIDFLKACDEVRAKAVALFDTKIALGPVTREELALLVTAADRYLQHLDTMQHAGLVTLTDDQREEIEQLQEVMVKVK